jgi:hypothetical protein
VPLLYIDFKESKLEARHNNNKGKKKQSEKSTLLILGCVRVELGTMLEQEMHAFNEMASCFRESDQTY